MALSGWGLEGDIISGRRNAGSMVNKKGTAFSTAPFLLIEKLELFLNFTFGNQADSQKSGSQQHESRWFRNRNSNQIILVRGVIS